jgi:hypothetical protein
MRLADFPEDHSMRHFGQGKTFLDIRLLYSTLTCPLRGRALGAERPEPHSVSAFR